MTKRTACLLLRGRPSVYAANEKYVWNNTGIDVELSRHYAGPGAYVSVPLLAVTPNDRNRSTIRGHLAALHDPNRAANAPA